MATHSSVRAWRIPRTGEPGGLPSLGSHRVRHDWSDLAAVAAAAVGVCEAWVGLEWLLDLKGLCKAWDPGPSLSQTSYLCGMSWSTWNAREKRVVVPKENWFKYLWSINHWVQATGSLPNKMQGAITAWERPILNIIYLIFKFNWVSYVFVCCFQQLWLSEKSFFRS